MGLRVKVKVDHERVRHQDLVFHPRMEYGGVGECKYLLRSSTEGERGTVVYIVVIE